MEKLIPISLFPCVNLLIWQPSCGMEERGRAYAEGKATYKGMAAGSNATEGLWIACPSGEALDNAKDVYWFESAYDAMAFYQITKNELKNGRNRDLEKELSRLDKSVFVSTGGNPSMRQFKGMIAETPEANHHLCFDRAPCRADVRYQFCIDQGRKNIQHTRHAERQADSGRYY